MNRKSTTVEINGDTEEIWFHELNPKLERSRKTYNHNYMDDYEDDYSASKFTRMTCDPDAYWIMDEKC